MLLLQPVVFVGGHSDGKRYSEDTNDYATTKDYPDAVCSYYISKEDRWTHGSDLLPVGAEVSREVYTKRVFLVDQQSYVFIYGLATLGEVGIMTRLLEGYTPQAQHKVDLVMKHDSNLIDHLERFEKYGKG